MVYVRLLFGATMLWELARLYAYGWIDRYYVRPSFHFQYFGFEWVEPVGESAMYAVFAVLALFAFLILIGLFYRVAAIGFFVLYLYIFLIEQARFQNHFYLLVLLAFLLAIMPAHAAFSLDARRQPKLRRASVSDWMPKLLRFQIGIVYIYGGLAKLNGDWLRGEPMRTFLERRAGDGIVDRLLAHDWIVLAMSYGGLLLDLAIVPLLMWRKTRVAAVVVLALFHVMNSRLFDIGVFPWFMLAATPIFFEPNVLQKLLRLPADSGQTIKQAPTGAVAYFLVLYIAIQLVVPLRHYTQPGNVLWIEHGRLFSWHMKIHAKEVRGEFRIVNPGRGTARVDPYQVLPRWQAERMLATPDMILQFAHRLAAEAQRQGAESVQVHARVQATLHGREEQWLVDPQIDLAKQKRTLWPADWIVPLE